MQDFLIAIIIGWILFRLFRPVVFVQWGGKRHSHQYNNSYPPQREGEIKVTETQRQNTNSNDSGEYVDYEELPPDKKN